MIKTERGVERLLRAQALQKGFLVYFVNPRRGSEGITDCILIDSEGRALFIEVKYTKSSKIRKSQVVFNKRVNHSFFAYYDKNLKKIKISTEPYSSPDEEELFLDFLDNWNRRNRDVNKHTK